MYKIILGHSGVASLGPTRAQDWAELVCALENNSIQDSSICYR